MRRALPLLVLAACTIPDKSGALPDSVYTTADLDVVIGAAHLRPDGSMTQHGGLFTGVTMTAGGYHLAIPSGTFGDSDYPRCACSAAGAACTITANDDGVGVAPQIEVSVVCAGISRGGGEQVPVPLVVTRDRSAAVVATANISAAGDISADGGFITAVTRAGTRWDATLAPVFAAPPICACTWQGGLADECTIDAVTATTVSYGTRGDGTTAASANLLCVGPAEPGAEEAVTTPGGRSSILASGWMWSDNTIVQQDGRWIDFLTGGGGDHVIELQRDLFGGGHRCVCSSIGGGCTLAALGDDQAHVRVTDMNGALAANAFMLICVGGGEIRR